MSSFSSLNSETPEPSGPTPSWRDTYRRYPYSPGTRQPFVYFLSATHGNKKGNDFKRNHKVNYFEKAFKWYTRERTFRAAHTDRPKHVPGFASWLDSKYFEYLQATERAKYTDEQNPFPQVEEVYVKKKISKRCRNGFVNMKGETMSLVSFEVLMEPKDVTSRAASICYYQAATAGKHIDSSDTTKNIASKTASAPPRPPKPCNCPTVSHLADPCDQHNAKRKTQPITKYMDHRCQRQKPRNNDTVCQCIIPTYNQCRESAVPRQINQPISSQDLRSWSNVNCMCAEMLNQKQQVTKSTVKYSDKNVDKGISRTRDASVQTEVVNNTGSADASVQKCSLITISKMSIKYSDKCISQTIIPSENAAQQQTYKTMDSAMQSSKLSLYDNKKISSATQTVEAPEPKIITDPKATVKYSDKNLPSGLARPVKKEAPAKKDSSAQTSDLILAIHENKETANVATQTVDANVQTSAHSFVLGEDIKDARSQMFLKVLFADVSVQK